MNPVKLARRILASVGLPTALATPLQLGSGHVSSPARIALIPVVVLDVI